MINYILIILICCFSFSSGNYKGGSLAFMNISPTANVRALGNTSAADINNPSSLILNPANIIQYSKWKFSFGTQKMSHLQGVNYSNVFLGRKLKNTTFGLGTIQYAVNEIEEYDSYANYKGNFSYSSIAMLMGVANKIGPFVWGVSISYIDEGFSIKQHNQHYGIDFGLTFLDVKIKDNKSYLTFGASIKSILKGIDYSNSNYSTSTAFFKLAHIIASNPNSIHTANFFGDLKLHGIHKTYFINLGLQYILSHKQNKLCLNLGLANLPIHSSENDYFNYLWYSKKFSVGTSIEIFKMKFQFAKLFDSYYDSYYLTISSTKIR